MCILCDSRLLHWLSNIWVPPTCGRHGMVLGCCSGSTLAVVGSIDPICGWELSLFFLASKCIYYLEEFSGQTSFLPWNAPTTVSDTTVIFIQQNHSFKKFPLRSCCMHIHMNLYFCHLSEILRIHLALDLSNYSLHFKIFSYFISSFCRDCWMTVNLPWR